MIRSLQATTTALASGDILAIEVSMENSNKDNDQNLGSINNFSTICLHLGP